MFISASFLLSPASSVRAEESPSQPAAGEEENSGADGLEDVFIMEDMDVVETINEGKTPGKTEIPREIIENVPSGNGGITDILTVAPGVQFSEDYRSAESAGEISPAKISISGAAYYDNLFLIDGMSNSSLLDPASDNPNLANDVAGDPQKFFINSWLVEDITVYDSNVSAAYDGFTGGVVDVHTRKPGTKLGGNFSYKGTGDPLTHFFVSDEDKASFDGGDMGKQLRFEKHFLSAALDIPVTDRGGVLLSYNRNWSVLPVRFFQGWENQSRLSETYYLKGMYNISGSSYIDTSFSYSPHNNQYFLKNTKDSEFRIKGGGYFGSANYVNEFGGHKIKAHLDYSWSENSKRAPDSYRSWATTSYKPWGIYSGADNDLSMEGGFGSIDKEEQSVKISFDHDIKPLEFFGEHNVSYGASYSFVQGRYRRLKDSATYMDATRSPDVICTDAFDCVDGDQYFSRRTVTPASDVNALVNAASAYIEDKYKIFRFELRAGARLSYDDYMKNFNAAPRTQISADIFGNGLTILTGGYNRYYSAPLLAYKLREGRAPSYTEKRWTYNNVVQPWSVSSDGSKSSYNYSGLRTPYSDEYMGGVTQRIFGSYVDLKYLERHSRDMVALSRSRLAEDGVMYYSFNNNGKSTYRSVQLKWTKSWGSHRVMANLTWQMSETSNNTYEDSFDLEDMDNVIYYNGRQIYAWQLPKDNFSRPVTVNLAYTGLFFDRLRVSLMLKYKSPYKAVEQIYDDSYGYTYVDPVTGSTVTATTSAYEDVEYGNNFTVDMGLEWIQPVWFGHKITVQAEVYNLLNTKNKIGKKYYAASNTDYELGIQAWFGVKYEF